MTGRGAGRDRRQPQDTTIRATARKPMKWRFPGRFLVWKGGEGEDTEGTGGGRHATEPRGTVAVAKGDTRKREGKTGRREEKTGSEGGKKREAREENTGKREENTGKREGKDEDGARTAVWLQSVAKRGRFGYGFVMLSAKGAEVLNEGVIGIV